nr:Chain E, GLN-GLU-ASP-PHE-SER-SER-ASP-SER-SER-PHE-SER [unidentified]
QEDFSSDSSFS